MRIPVLIFANYFWEKSRLWKELIFFLFLKFDSAILFSVSSSMIERSVVEAAVQECSQSVDETMYVGTVNFIPHWRCY